MSGGTGATNLRFESSTFISAGVGAVLFQGSSTADTATIDNTSGGVAWFEDSSQAGSANITNGQFTATVFVNSSTAASATIVDKSNSITIFADSSTAGSATIIDNASTAWTSAGISLLAFVDSSTAGQSHIINDNAGANTGGLIFFGSGTTAGSATIDNKSEIVSDLAQSLQAEMRAATQQIAAGGADSATIANKFDLLIAQHPDQSPVPLGGLVFINGANAGSATINNTQFGLTEFATSDDYIGIADAGTATITNVGTSAGTWFLGSSTADNAKIINQSGGVALFAGNGATAANSTITNGGLTFFTGQASAANAQINNSAGLALFMNKADAGSATINNTDGFVFFYNADAGSATINTTSGVVVFTQDGNINASPFGADQSTLVEGANSVLAFMGLAQGTHASIITTDPTAIVDFSGATPNSLFDYIRIGSIAGSGQFELGGNTLVVGENNSSTVISSAGTITNSGHFSSSGSHSGGIATLEKDGTGTLTIDGLVSRTNLTVSDGTLVIAGTISGAGQAAIAGQGGELEFNGAYSENVTFNQGATGRTLKHGYAAKFYRHNKWLWPRRHHRFRRLFLSERQRQRHVRFRKYSHCRRRRSNLRPEFGRQ